MMKMPGPLAALALLVPRRVVVTRSRSSRTLVSLHGRAALSPVFRTRKTGGLHHIAQRPPNPSDLLTAEQQQEQIDLLLAWWQTKEQVLCISGAGVSTESGIPDYRGHEGSYHVSDHTPMIHDQFMSSQQNRQRYWGRGMVGWRSFDEMQPAAGHSAIAALESMGLLGVSFDDQQAFYETLPEDDDAVDAGRGKRHLALVTQNVDSLHRRAGSQHMIELHGRTDSLKCMHCGTSRDRNSFQAELESMNADWLAEARRQTVEGDMRPDGDANVRTADYGAVQIPPCSVCGGFLKPDVVFFGDSVPKHRQERVRSAVDHADGLLVVGSSLTVHSAFKHVRAARQKGIPVCILNVGQTRAEAEGLDVLKIEAPIGSTLSAVVAHFAKNEEAANIGTTTS